MSFGIASFAAITIIAYLAGFAWKTADKLPDKWTPVICGSIGCILGIVAYLIKVPDFPAEDILNAAAVGIASGFAATGIHQIYKQFKKDSIESQFESEPSSDELLNSEDNSEGTDK